MLVRFGAALLALSVSACTATVAGEVEPEGDDDPGLGEDDDLDEPGVSDDLCQAEFENVTLDPVPPTVHLLIDMSGSMQSHFGNRSRWEAVRYALTDPAQGVVTQLQSEIFFGASLYHSERGNWGGQCAMIDNEPARLDNLDRINALLDRGKPQLDTPTAEAIDEIAAGLLPGSPGSQRYLVLATDGNPDTCGDPDAHTLEAQILTENAIDRAFAAGVTTLILSVGNDITREHLRRSANLGAGEPVYTGNAPYYLANDPAELVTELDALVADTLATCSFTVPQQLPQSAAATAELELDGALLTFGVDWRWVDPHTVELLGAACDRVLADPALQLHGEFRCE